MASSRLCDRCGSAPDRGQVVDGQFFYRDIYVGMAYFVGQKIVSYQHHSIWFMSYAGGVAPAVSGRTEIGAIYSFVRLALRQGTVDQPYRGPAVVRENPSA